LRITLRLILVLVLAASTVVALSTAYQTWEERARLRDDVGRRGASLARSLRAAIDAATAWDDPAALDRLVHKFARLEGLTAVAACDETGDPPVASGGPKDLRPLCELTRQGPDAAGRPARFATFLGRPSHVTVDAPGDGDGRWTLVLVQDASFIDADLRALWKRDFLRLLLHVMVLSLATLWVIRWNVTAPIANLAEWMKRIRTGESPAPPPSGVALLGAVATEASQLAQSLTEARTAAQEEARLRVTGELMWTADRLREHVKLRIADRPLFVVANREPYMHTHKGKAIAVIKPASGLVTGLEPILRACGGLWLAHGSGDADRETVDDAGKVGVPPESPQYTLKRVWLSKEEEEGYYYGLSNEGLWPLCHIAHTRPVFRPEDWQHYQAVNQRFADSLLEELRGTEEPCVLIQDYHFALVPEMVKSARPDARVALFWHIPWPNPEAFGICPWQRDILVGMLGADIVGFHIQFHCNNFLETVDRALESRIDWERFAVRRKGRATAVRAYPISIAFPRSNGSSAVHPDKVPDKEALLKELGVKGDLLGVGVDRVDYTKGIVERFRAVERLLEESPGYLGRLVFVELGAPSRTLIKRYHELGDEVEAEAARINGKFAAKGWQPIVLLLRHHSHEEIEPYYRAADLCMVTSLHDGMNLVAKEFVAARDDERGVLVLSRFTGAARELRDSLIVNPYDVQQTAAAIRRAVEMDPGEQAARMAAMRRTVAEQNVYRWAGRLIEDLAGVRIAAATG
jgi:trehalose-6-phosphate synthase